MSKTGKWKILMTVAIIGIVAALVVLVCFLAMGGNQGDTQSAISSASQTSSINGITDENGNAETSTLSQNGQNSGDESSQAQNSSSQPEDGTQGGSQQGNGGSTASQSTASQGGTTSQGSGATSSQGSGGTGSQSGSNDSTSGSSSQSGNITVIDGDPDGGQWGPLM